MLCNCLTKKGNHCQNKGGNAIQHENHIHDVCTSHIKANDRKYFNCDRARKVMTQIAPGVLVNSSKGWTGFVEATKQEVLPMSNTDGLGHLEEIQEHLAKRIFTCNIVGCTNFDKMTEEEFSQHIKDSHMVRIMLTGHADLVNEGRIQVILENILQGYINTYGAKRIMVVAGASLGADWLWARVAYKLQIPYELYVPEGYGEVFVLQHKVDGRKWEVRPNGREMLAKWYKMLELADHVYNEKGEDWDANGKYSRGANFRRNTKMVQVSQHHIAVSKSDPRIVVRQQRWNGGTYHCIREMKRLGVNEVLWVPDTNGLIRNTHIVRLNEEKK